MVKKTNASLSSPFITAYLVGGFPSWEESISILKEAVNAGLDAVEIGFPSENPYLDGDIIKRAHQEAKDLFPTTEDFIDYVKKLRQAIPIPIWIMGYEKDLVQEDVFLDLANSSYIDGFVIPDLETDQFVQVQEKLKQTDVKIIPVINNEMTDKEIDILVQHKEVVYCQLYAGKTGHKLTNTDDLPEFHQRIRGITDAKLMAGFGIKNQHIAGEIFEVGYDGIVVGSEFVRQIALEGETSLYEFIKELADAKKKWG